MQNEPIETGTVDGLYPDITGVILAGGRSSRMGRDKATLEFGGVSLFERVLAVFRELFPRVLIAGDRPDLVGPDLPCFPDRYPGSALGGLYTGLAEAPTPYIFAVACDMPYPRTDLFRALIEQRHGFDVVVPSTPAGLEPLIAVYGKNCLGPMRDLLEERRYRIYEFYPQVRVRYMDTAELPPGWEKGLRNINTPEDYRKIEEGL